jgi:hypothetical protein
VLRRNGNGRLTTDPQVKDGTVYFRGAQVVDVTRDARWINRASFYTQAGDWFVAVSAALAAFAFALLRVTPATED